MIDSGDRRRPPGGRRAGRVRVTYWVEDDEEIVVYTEPHTDDFGHGTACAGIIRSLAPDCELYSVKVLGPRLRGRGDVFAAEPALGDRERDARVQPQPGDDEARLLRRRSTSSSTRRTSGTSCSSTAANNMPTPSFPSTLRLGDLGRVARPARRARATSTTPSRRSSSARSASTCAWPWQNGELDHGDRQQLRRAAHRRARRAGCSRSIRGSASCT